VDIAAFSTRLLDNRELFPRARIIAEAVTDFLPGTGANVYLLLTLDEAQVWAPHASVGDVTVHDSAVASDRGTLGVISVKPEPLIFSEKELMREQYAHLNVRRTLHSLAYLPLKHHGELVGAIEILGFEGPISGSSLASLQPLAETAASALANAASY